MNSLQDLKKIIAGPLLESRVPIRTIMLEIIEHLEALQLKSNTQEVPTFQDFQSLYAQVQRIDNFRCDDLRDWFAGCALQGLITSDCKQSKSKLAGEAYGFADAMIAHREDPRANAHVNTATVIAEQKERRDARCFYTVHKYKDNAPTPRCNQTLGSHYNHKYPGGTDTSLITSHEFVDAPPIPCVCGARFNEPVHDPQYGGHTYQMGEHKYDPTPNVNISPYVDICRWCGLSKQASIHTITKPK